MRNLLYLTATDLFNDQKQQVFSAKTGEYLGLVDAGSEISVLEKLDAKEIEKQTIDNNQLKLF
jgi:hypothetical protein